MTIAWLSFVRLSVLIMNLGLLQIKGQVHSEIKALGKLLRSSGVLTRNENPFIPLFGHARAFHVSAVSRQEQNGRNNKDKDKDDGEYVSSVANAPEFI